MANVQLSAGVEYLHDRIKHADQMVAVLLDQIDQQAQRIIELEKQLEELRSKENA